jgi:hypothetical protein
MEINFLTYEISVRIVSPLYKCSFRTSIKSVMTIYPDYYLKKRRTVVFPALLQLTVQHPY